MNILKLIALATLAISPVFIQAKPVLAAACPTPIIHRGNVQNGAAQNTVRAFTDSFALGYEWVETDTFFTADGYPVLFHDATVDATTNGSGAVTSLTLAQFTSLKYRNGQPTSTLQDALPLFQTGNRHLLLEIKHALSTAQQQTLITMLSDYESNVHLNGFAPTLSSLVAIKNQNPLIDISYLAHDAKNNLVAGMSGKNIDYTQINFLNVSSLHNSGYIVRAWTPNSIANWRAMKFAGVDAIITDKAVEYKNWMATGCN